MNRFISNWYYFWGHTMWHITDFKFWSWFMDDDDEDMEIKIPYRVWSFFWNRYQSWMGKALNDNETYELYEWQKKYYG